jgi:hypothetical protein
MHCKLRAKVVLDSQPEIWNDSGDMFIAQIDPPPGFEH